MRNFDTEAQAAKDFVVKVKKIFPDFMIDAGVVKNLGGSLFVEFANIKDISEAPHRIILNVPGHMRFYINLSDAYGRDVYPETLEVTNLILRREAKDAGVKYRKITGKTAGECLDKLAKWFEKNAEAIKAI